MPERKANKTLVTATQGLPGTDGYRPPEYSDGKYSVLSDVYSYGVVGQMLVIIKCHMQQIFEFLFRLSLSVSLVSQHILMTEMQTIW